MFRRKTGVSIADDTDITWFEELRSGAITVPFQGTDLTTDQVMAARHFLEMECIVRALDSMETIASSEAMAQECVFSTNPVHLQTLDRY